MENPIGPDGLPCVFEGGAWFSQDHRFRWSGAAWQPVKAPRFTPPWIKIGLGLVFGVIVIYALYESVISMSPSAQFSAGYYIGGFLFLGTLVLAYRFVGRWGWIGMVLRVLFGALAILKILTLITHPPPV